MQTAAATAGRLRLFAVEQLGGVVLDVAYILTDLEGFHLIGGERAQKVEGRTGRVGVAVEPAIEVSGWRMTGIRSWTEAINSFAFVVMMV